MKPKLYPNYYDIVILPPGAVRDYAISLSQTLQPRGAKWVLGAKRFIPHISLYHIPVKPERFAAFAGALEQAVRGTPAGRLQTTGIESNLLMLDKPAWLRRLYLKVIKRTRPYFDWDYGVDRLWQIDHFAAGRRRSMRRSLAQYGTPMVGINFRPHIHHAHRAER
jgi:hypothetical protein